ncbi:MAG: DEAD/DEAH box helicase [Kofleriaceae bacterium]|nr:DEAD/DEAH box helicase [Kofleriaceae bacterium]
MIQFSTNALRQTAEHFEEKTLHRGIRYAMEERVDLIKSESWPIVAKVRGTQTYIVTVDYNSGSHHLHCRCDCPVAIDCKHAAAAALVYYELCEDEVGSQYNDYQAQAVGEWLANLGHKAQTLSAVKRDTNARIVAYVLDRSNTFIGICFHRTSKLKRGGLARSTRMASISEPGRNVPPWIEASDLRIMSTIRALDRASSYEATHSIGALDGAIFRELQETGRLFWGDVHSLPLQWGPERSAALSWQECEDDPGEYRLGIEDSLILIPAEQTHYVDLNAGLIGSLDLGLPAGILKSLVSGPAVPASMLATAEKSLRSLLLPNVRDAIFPQALPENSDTIEHQLQQSLQVEIGRNAYGEQILSQASAHYGDAQFSLGEWSESPMGVTRDMAAEGRFAARLEAIVEDSGLRPFTPGKSQRELLVAAQDVAHRIIPTLVAEGWQCELADDFPADLPIMNPEWNEDLTPLSQGHDWFSLGLGVSIDGRTIELLPILLEAISDGRINFADGAFSRQQPVGINLCLPSGEMVHIPGKRLERWIRPLIELKLRGLNSDDKLVVPSFSAVDLMEGSGESAFASSAMLSELRAHLESLVDLKPAKAGKSFNGSLRGYQEQGLAWLRFLHKSGYGGLLCDDMGLGKTIQLLAFMDGLRSSRKLPRSSPCLVIAPRSVLGNWLSECKRFTPKLEAHVHLGSARAQSVTDLCSARVVITSYQTLLRDIKLFSKVSWTSIIFDEAQALKNPSTKLRRAASKLKAHSRFCVTGTPIENHLEELWSQIDLVMPGLMGNRSTFAMVFRKPIEKYGDSRALKLLQQRIRPFLLRRKKSEVDIDLPEKTVVLEHITLDTQQRDLYESLRVVLDKKVRKALTARGVQASSLVILDALLRLRQCCCDPRLVKLPQAQKVKTSAKLDRLMSMLDELADAGRFTLVFSQFTSMLRLIEEECKEKGIGYVTLTGQTRNRDAVIARFQAGDVPVFLISLKAGGVGLNLTQADTVIHYDPWWNPAVENQASDRAHRIGQTKNVMVYKLIAEKTLEDRICVMQKEKQLLTDAALSEGGLTHFGADDLRALFQSL